MFSESKFSARSEEALRLAHKCSSSLGHSCVGSEHLLYGILSQGEGDASAYLLRHGITREKLYLKIKNSIGIGDMSCSITQGLTPCVRRIIGSAFSDANRCGCTYISTEHLLYGILSHSDSTACKILTSFGVDISRMQGDIALQSEREARPHKEKQGSEKLIRQFGVDLTEQARLGALDPVIGRDEEISRMMCILSRRNKNNPLLIGEPGVGKTSVVEGLARQIALGTVSDPLKKYRIISLDMPSIIAGTKYRGEFEDRVKNLLREVKSSGNIILFIDELHIIVGAGAAEGAIDAANILKPALARGEIKLIGATTNAEYRRHVEKDQALERRFEPIQISEPSREKAFHILKGLAPLYEAHHHMEISDELISAAISLSSRYICNRFLPDKAIDLIDEAASRASFMGECLDENHLRRVIFERTGIPTIKTSEEVPLIQRLSRRVFGQDKAVAALCSAVMRANAGLGDPNRPYGSFLFSGQSGVGKTLLAKALADELFGSKKSFIRLDMSEYMEKHTASKLVGAPPGYVGYGDGSYLADKIRQNPYSVILFDEIEKAHPDVLNILLQILDEGELLDSKGRICNFKNSIIILTSNLGAASLDPSHQIGFLKDSSGYESKAMSQIKKQLSPELINRIDEIILFSPLSLSALEQIAAHEVSKALTRAQENGINIQIEQEVISLLARRALEKNKGARALRRMIEEEILTKIAESTTNSQNSNSIKCILCNDIPTFMHI